MQDAAEYAIYTDKIRPYTEEMSLEEAVDRAIRECIHEDILREFLEKPQDGGESDEYF